MCVYSHGESSSSSLMHRQTTNNRKTSEPCIPIVKEFSLDGGVLGWFIKNHNHCVLLGEGNFEFSNSLVDLQLPPLVATTNELNCLPSGVIPKRKARSLIGVDATRLHTNNDLFTTIERNYNVSVNVVWNFPFITDEDENTDEHEILIRDTFQSVKLLFRRLGPIDGKLFCLGLQGDQFSRWNVLKSAWAVGWELHSWDTYRFTNFPDYAPRRLNEETIPITSPRFYVFIENGGR